MKKLNKLPMKYMDFGRIDIRRNLLFLTLSFILISCGPTPSEERFERATRISIPNDVEVLKEEYQDMFQDYGIEYSIRLTSTQLDEVIMSIRRSDLYNPFVIGDELIQDDYFPNESSNAVWFRTNSGYLFASRNDRTGVTASLDTTTLIMEFSE